MDKTKRDLENLLFNIMPLEFPPNLEKTVMVDGKEVVVPSAELECDCPKDEDGNFLIDNNI